MADASALVLPVRMQVGDSDLCHVGDVEFTADEVMNGSAQVAIPRFLRAMADHIEAQHTTDPEGDTTMARGKAVSSHESNATITDNQAGVSQRTNRGARMTTAGGSGTSPIRHRNAPKPPEGGGSASGPSRHPASPIASPSAVNRPHPA